MSRVTHKEKAKRGCDYCLDFRKKRNQCKHSECPYHELDGVESYEQYFQKQEGLQPFAEILKL